MNTLCQKLFDRGYFYGETVDFLKKKSILYLYNKIPLNLPGMISEPEEEDSLENTLSCVPKVQGESRISQANGRRSRCKFAVFYAVAVLQGLLFL